jgi:chemotaxis protein CheC
MQLTPIQIDILQELINIGVGRAASMLNRMVATHIRLHVPEVRVLNTQELLDLYQAQGAEQFAAVSLTFSGKFSGRGALVFPPDSAAKLVSIIVGQEALSMDMDSLRIGTLQEVGNIVLNGVMGSIANILNEHIAYSPLDYYEGRLPSLVKMDCDPSSTVLLARARFDLEQLSISGDVIILFHLGTFDVLLQAIDQLTSSASRG